MKFLQARSPIADLISQTYTRSIKKTNIDSVPITSQEIKSVTLTDVEGPIQQ